MSLEIQEILDSIRTSIDDIDSLVTRNEYVSMYNDIKKELRPRGIATDIVNVLQLRKIINDVTKEQVRDFYKGKKDEKVLKGYVALQMLVEYSVPFSREFSWWDYHIRVGTPVFLDKRPRIGETLH